MNSPPRTMFSSDTRHTLANAVADRMHAIAAEMGLTDPFAEIEEAGQFFDALWEEVRLAVAVGSRLHEEDIATPDPESLFQPQAIEVVVDIEPGDAIHPIRWQHEQ